MSITIQSAGKRSMSKGAVACFSSALMVGLILSGCGGPDKVNATNKDTLKLSKARVSADMTPEQKQQFDKDCNDVGLNTPRPKSTEKVEFNDPGIFKALDGMTAEEIHKKAEEIRATKGGGIPKP